MTRGELCKLLEDEAKEYRKNYASSLVNNKHMHEYRGNPYKLTNTLVDALLVDFINHVAVGQGLDLGLYTKDLKNERQI